MLRSLALLALSLPLAAQSGRPMRPAPAPVETVHYDAATGVITRGAAQQRAGSEVSTFSNLDLSGFVAVDTGGGSVTWINDGTKGAVGNASEMFSSFVIPYCSSELDPSLGGPGATLKLGFYEGFTRNSATPSGTKVADFTLTGLPGHSSDSSFFGGFTCYFLQVDLDPLVSFADGPIGYSWEFADLGTDGVYAGTFPLLADAGSCPATVPDPQGQMPYECCSIRPADAYDASGQLIAVFTFVPYCIPNSIAIELREAADVAASVTPFAGDGVNLDTLSASAPVVGGTWSAQLTLGHGHGTSGLVRVNVRSTSINGPTLISPIGGRPFESLVSGPLLASFLTTHDGVASAPLSTRVPASLSLVCTPFAAQATITGGGFVDLSTGVIGSLGTH